MRKFECTQCGLVSNENELVKIDDPKIEDMQLHTCPKCGNGEFYPLSNGVEK